MPRLQKFMKGHFVLHVRFKNACKKTANMQKQMQTKMQKKIKNAKKQKANKILKKCKKCKKYKKNAKKMRKIRGGETHRETKTRYTKKREETTEHTKMCT